MMFTLWSIIVYIIKLQRHSAFSSKLPGKAPRWHSTLRGAQGKPSGRRGSKLPWHRIITAVPQVGLVGVRGMSKFVWWFSRDVFQGVFTSSVRLTRYVEASVKMKKSMDPALGHNGYRDNIDLHRFAWIQGTAKRSPIVVVGTSVSNGDANTWAWT